MTNLDVQKKLLETLGISKKYLEARSLATAENSEETLESVLKTEIVITRFPPEPNGHLHIGHAKAINFNFLLAGIRSSEEGFAKSHKESKNKVGQGFTILRFDDTNPMNESAEYIESIFRSVTWLGFVPTAVTHASDYFPQLFDFAKQLIQQNDAFVCFLSAEEAKRLREQKASSPYREKFSQEENLAWFMKMADGELEEGTCVLRLKLDFTHANPTMRDPPIYRILKQKHAREAIANDDSLKNNAVFRQIREINKKAATLTGLPETVKQAVQRPFCYSRSVYPLYDYTHCICDSLEKVTMSCCTLEFEVRRDLYYAVLAKLQLYRPFVFEYSRLALQNALTSKRKIKTLIAEGKMSGWDDPRLMTLAGLRNRGVPAKAINRFVRERSITRNDGTEVERSLFDETVREELDTISPRAFCVKKEKMVELRLNFGDETRKEIFWVPTFPNDPENTLKHTIIINKAVFIDVNDFREKANKKYFGLVANANKKVRLKYCANISFRKLLETNDKSTVLEVAASVSEPRAKKGSLSFVADTELENGVELRLYEDGEKMEVKKAIVSAFVFDELAKGTKWFQFERKGFFYLSEDSVLTLVEGKLDRRKSNVIFNLVVGLKISKEKEKLMASLTL